MNEKTITVSKKSALEQCSKALFVLYFSGNNPPPEVVVMII